MQLLGGVAAIVALVAVCVVTMFDVILVDVMVRCCAADVETDVCIAIALGAGCGGACGGPTKCGRVAVKLG